MVEKSKMATKSMMVTKVTKVKKGPKVTKVTKVTNVTQVTQVIKVSGHNIVLLRLILELDIFDFLEECIHLWLDLLGHSDVEQKVVEAVDDQ